MRCMRITWLIMSLTMAASWTSTALAAQEEPVYGQMIEQFKRPYLSFGMVLQTVADFQFDRSAPGSNGFSIVNARFSIAGELDWGFGYFLQTNFVDGPAVLDAYMTYAVSPSVGLRIGQLKAPFSAEFLISAESTDFVNRAQAVTSLAPGRQLGAQVEVAVPDRSFGVTLGVFNGNGTDPNGNDSDDLMYGGRLFLQSSLGSNTTDHVQLGLNFAKSDDAGANIPGIFGSFTGSRTLVGFDVRATMGAELLSGEVIFAALDPTPGAQRDPWGFHVTAGHLFTPKIQGLLRWDRFDEDNLTDATNLIIAGLNMWPTMVTEFQVNYIIDTDNADVDQHRVLVNFQFNF